MSGKWDKKYAEVNPYLIEELARLRHDQVRGWSRALFQILSEYQYNGRSLEEFGTEMLRLTKDNWVDYEKLDPALKTQSRTFAYAVIDILKKYSSSSNNK